jgi:hypothetical protein
MLYFLSHGNAIFSYLPILTHLKHETSELRISILDTAGNVRQMPLRARKSENLTFNEK